MIIPIRKLEVIDTVLLKSGKKSKYLCHFILQLKGNNNRPISQNWNNISSVGASKEDNLSRLSKLDINYSKGSLNVLNNSSGIVDHSTISESKGRKSKGGRLLTGDLGHPRLSLIDSNRESNNNTVIKKSSQKISPYEATGNAELDSGNSIMFGVNNDEDCNKVVCLLNHLKLNSIIVEEA